jgi:hypothetical protein
MDYEGQQAEVVEASEACSKVRRNPHPARNESRTIIYFVQCDVTTNIKIGISSDVPRRLKQIIGQRRKQLTVLATVPGTFGQEQRLHAQLGAFSVGAEWYRDCAEIRKVISRCKVNIADASKNPLGELRKFGSVARILWPKDTAACLAAIAKCDERHAKRFLSGEYEPPLSVVLAVVHEMLREQTELNL